VANTAGMQRSIGNGQTMNADAAAYALALRALVFAMVGVWVVFTEGTRTYDRQNYLYVNRNKPGFNPAWPPWSIFAYHMSGRAVDVGSEVGYVKTAVSRAFYSVAGAYGFRPTVPGEPWHFEWRLEWVRPDIRRMVENGTAAPAAATPPAIIRTDDDEMLSTQAQEFLRELFTGQINQAVSLIRVAVRREGRARLYFDAGPTGREFTEDSSPRAIAARVTVGFIYPLSPDPQARQGQVASLRNTHYLLIDGAEVFEGLPTAQFDNLVEMANGHLRRIAAAISEYESADPKIPVTLTAPRGASTPTRALPLADEPGR
jgi:hypothetical protein